MPDSAPQPDFSPTDQSALSRDLQQFVDDVCDELRDQPVSAMDLRSCAQQSVRDLYQSISRESLPEMAARLTLVRVAAWCASAAGAKTGHTLDVDMS